MEKNTSETLYSLKFAERVRSVELGPGSRRTELGSWSSQEQPRGGPSAFLLAGATPPLRVPGSRHQSRLALAVSAGTLTSDHSRALRVGEATPLSTVETGDVAGLQVRCQWQCTPVSHLPDELTCEELTRLQTQRRDHLPHSRAAGPALSPSSPASQPRAFLLRASF